MKKKSTATIIFIVLLLVAAGIVLGLSTAPLKPSVRTIEQTVPDDRIPH